MKMIKTEEQIVEEITKVKDLLKKIEDGSPEVIKLIKNIEDFIVTREIRRNEERTESMVSQLRISETETENTE